MTKPKMQTKCPCCGHALAEPVALSDDNMVHLSTNEQALFNLIKANGADGITCRAILERLFHTNRDGEPYSHNIVAVTAHNANVKIVAWGLKLVSTGGPGSVYRLVQL
jgi:hypothetical protein